MAKSQVPAKKVVSKAAAKKVATKRVSKKPGVKLGRPVGSKNKAK